MTFLPGDACLIRKKYSSYFIWFSLSFKHKDWTFRLYQAMASYCVFAILPLWLSNKTRKGKIYKLHFSVSHTVPGQSSTNTCWMKEWKRLTSTILVLESKQNISEWHSSTKIPGIFRAHVIQRLGTKLSVIQSRKMSVLNLYTWHSPSVSFSLKGYYTKEIQTVGSCPRICTNHNALKNRDSNSRYVSSHGCG